jgi:transposase-like protein
MKLSDFDSLISILDHFGTEGKCVEHLAIVRWGGRPVCPYCGCDRCYDMVTSRGRMFMCSSCRRNFSVRVGTVFEESKLPLRKWFVAIYLATAHKKGISSHQLARDIAVTQKTAWFMLQRIRGCLGLSDGEKVDSMGAEGVVELDETFVGGKNKNRHKDKKVRSSGGRSHKDKTPVLGILERGGNVMCVVVPDTQQETIHPVIEQVVVAGAKVMSDEWSAYRGLHTMYDHRVVNHAAKEYVNAEDGSVHNNGIENFWSIFKRGIIGIYHWTSRKHLQRYCDEFAFRFNTRKVSQGERFELFLMRMERRTTYKQLISG